MAIIKNPVTIMQSGSGENKIPQIMNKTVTILTAEDLAGSIQIADYIFQSCFGLTSITIPDSVTSIGSSAFYACGGLTEVDLSNCTSLTSIGSYAFQNCTNLITMRVKALTPPTLSSTNAISTATTQIQVPMASVDAYKTATNWSNFADIIVGYDT